MHRESCCSQVGFEGFGVLLRAELFWNTPAVCACPGGAEQGGGKGGLINNSSSPKRSHGAIPGTFPPHPVTAKQSPARKGLALLPREGWEEGGGDGGRQHRQGSPKPTWTPSSHQGPRDRDTNPKTHLDPPAHTRDTPARGREGSARQ